MGEKEGSMMPPGFRFHPTDEELVVHYLKPKAASCPIPVSIITDIDLYKFNPWDLPAKANFGEKEWYFFSPRDRKYPNGARPNRAAGCGYWKATGTDKIVVTRKDAFKVGVKKALVFYKGKPPKGIKTDWIMHEYRLTDVSVPKLVPSSATTCFAKKSLRLDDWVLCRIYKKAQAPKADNELSSSPKEMEMASSSSSYNTADPNNNNNNNNNNYYYYNNNNNNYYYYNNSISYNNSYHNNNNKHADVLPRLGSFGTLLADADLFFVDNLMPTSSAPNADVMGTQQQQHVFKAVGPSLPYVPKLENEETDPACYFTGGAGKRGGGAGFLPDLEGPLLKKSNNNNNNNNNGFLLPQFNMPSFYPDPNARTWPTLSADAKFRF